LFDRSDLSFEYKIEGQPNLVCTQNINFWIKSFFPPENAAQSQVAVKKWSLEHFGVKKNKNLKYLGFGRCNSTGMIS